MTPVANMPEFFASPEPAWVLYEDTKDIGSAQVACSVRRFSGGTGIVITTSDYLDKESKRVWGIVIGAVPKGGRLVDFPSGERLAVPEGIVQPVNGSSI
jgi:hypothetical protein